MKFNKIYKEFYWEKIRFHFRNHWLRYLQSAILVFLIVLVSDRINTWFFRPSKMYTLLDRFFYDYTLSHPELLTKTKAFKWPYASSSLEGSLNNESLIQTEKDFEYLKDELEFLSRYDRKKLTKDEKLSRDIFEFLMEVNILDRWIYEHVKYPIDHIEGIQVQLPLFMINCHSIENVNEAYNYIYRLEEAQDKVSELISGKPLFPSEVENRQTSKGILYRRENESLEEAIHHFNINEDHALPPKVILALIHKQLEAFLSVPLEENIFYKDFMSKVTQLDNDDIKQKLPELEYQLKKAIEGSVIPSFDALMRTVDEVYMQAEEEITLMRFEKEGDDYYRHLIQYTCGLNQEEIENDFRPRNLNYEARKLVSREKKKLGVLFDSLGLEGTTLREQFESFYQKQNIDQKWFVYNDFQKYFQAAPFIKNQHKPIEIRRLPHFMSNFDLEPFYYEGSFDSSRAGRVYLCDSLSKYQEMMMPVFAISSAAQDEWSKYRLENKKLPLFRRELSFNYIVEFWKNIYLSTYYKSATLEERALYQIWRLNNAIMMRCDLGIHHFLWTKREAVEYVFENSILNFRDSEKIVEKSTSLPASFVAKGFAMKLVDQVCKERNIYIDNQIGREVMSELFIQGGLTYSSYKEILKAE
ncbi:DUF885 family protein [Flammeovirga sp. SubArs3]|uniref:DUF885 family protein n=1 Tax=Flammeovirga sp. SubArs3 TaxID=2995316 RepID=UPI00248AF4B3|nr:DUF885 family protein [Flammeovirga sp. SubArs3]